MDETQTEEQGPQHEVPTPRLRAVALQYKDVTELPKVISVGADEMAAKIIALAKSHGIPVKRDDTLADILTRIPVGAVIPEKSFQLVAQIVSFLYHCDKDWRQKHPSIGTVLPPDAAVPAVGDQKE